MRNGSIRVLVPLLVFGCGLVESAPPTTEPGSRDGERSLSSIIGFYHWGGPPGNDFRAGVARLHELHAHVPRVALSARMDLDYQRGGRCIPGFSLPATLDDPDVRFMLNDNQLDTLILTAYDGMGFADCVTPTYLVPAFYTEENTARMVREYEKFVYRLRSLTQMNPSK